MFSLRNRTAAVALLAIAGLAGAALAGTEPRTDWKEFVSPDEGQAFPGFAKEINALQDSAAQSTGLKVDRAFHAKHHNVVKAELKIINDALPEAQRAGIFAQNQAYKTWVRLSNGQGKAQADRSPDVRGFAVKIMGVPGQALTAGLASWDLLCINFEAQPARDINQFMAIVRAAGNPLTLPIKLAAALGLRESGRVLAFLATHLGKRVNSMASTDFYSALPMACGKFAMKVRFQPKNEDSVAAASDADYLRHDLEARLKKGDLKWDMLVQFYNDEHATPIEDASVAWSAPFIKVGELTMTQRDLTSTASVADEAEGNGLLWNPWHAPVEHRPLGSLMRARRVVYPASGAHRGATHE